MENHFSRKKVLSSLFWKLLERTGTQGIQLVIQIILARLLAPSEFGLIAIVLVVINLAQVFVQSGFNTALIQKKNADELDFSSAFFLSLMIAIIIYLLMLVSAPAIAAFYDNPALISLVRVLAIVLFPGALNSIQNAYVAKHMLFRKLFLSSFCAVSISGILGVILAYSGFGVWALVAQHITNQLLITIIMWFTIKWRPKLVFSIYRIKNLFAFGWKILASSLIENLYANLGTLIIGRRYTAASLGYYNRGESFPKTIVTNLNGAIQTVMLPTFSAYQDDRVKLKSLVRRSILTSSFTVFPAMIGLAAVSNTIIPVLLTGTWNDAIPFLQVFCLTYMLYPIHSANLQAINAIGRSDIFLKVEIAKKLVGITILIISVPMGVLAIAWGQLFTGIISSFINAFPNKKLLDYSYQEQIIDILPNLILSVIMGSVVYILNYLSLSNLFILFIQIIVGLIIYLLLSYITGNKSFKYVSQAAKEFQIMKK